MKFTLVYTGRLPSSSNATIKHGIRQALHPQLKELWDKHIALADKKYWLGEAAPAGVSESDVGVLVTEIANKRFATIVHPYLKVFAELDILVLRPEAPGAVISHSGDIDNQLKTLFDALRRPVDSSEIPNNWEPSDDQVPLISLLDDDKLITRVNIETDRLLVPGSNPKDVSVTIRVTIKGITATWGNLGMTS